MWGFIGFLLTVFGLLVAAGEALADAPIPVLTGPEMFGVVCFLLGMTLLGWDKE